MTTKAGEPTYARPVTHVDLLLTLVGFLVSSGLTALLLVLLVRTGVDVDAAVILTVTTGTVLWLVGIAWALRRRGWCWGDLGLAPPRGSVGWVWQVPLVWIVVLALTTAIGSRLLGPGEGNVEPSAGAALNLGSVAVIGLLVAVVAVGPLAEEIIFRRILLGWLEARVGVVVAVVAQAVVFGALHVIPQAILLTGLLGLAAGILARRHRSLWPALALHSLNNLVATTTVIMLLA